MKKSFAICKGLILTGILVMNITLFFIPATGEFSPQQPNMNPSPPPIDARHTIFVDSHSKSPGNGTKAWPYSKIRYAVDNATTGDTIFVYRGTYNEKEIEINKPLTLHGEERDNTIIDAQAAIWSYIFSSVAQNVTITGFTLHNYSYKSAGIYCSARYNNISGNKIAADYLEDNRDTIGLSINYDHTIVRDNKISFNTIGIEVYDISNIIQHNVLTDNNQYSIFVMSDHNDISNNYISNSVQCELHFNPSNIRLVCSCNNTIRGNTIFDDSYNPNIVLYGIGGIFTEPSRDNLIENNVCTANNSDCVQLISIFTPGVNNNTFVDNTFSSKKHHGIFFNDDVLQTTLYKNSFQNCGISMSGNLVTFTNQEIPENNTVNGKPIYYYKNQNLDGTSVPHDAGEVIIGNCSGLALQELQLGEGSSGIVCGYSSYLRISDITISHSNENGITMYNTSDSTLIRNTVYDCGAAGIYIESVSFPPPPPPLRGTSSGSTNNSISDCSITNNYIGIYCVGATHQTVSRNIILGNSRYGIQLEKDCTYNNFIQNIIRHNGIFLGYGIEISGSSYNLIQANMIENNGYLWSGGIVIQSDESGKPCHNEIKDNTIANSTNGIYIYDMYGAGKWDNNLIYHNNFINETTRGYDECVNAWDNGYPSGGNYWDNYTGVDDNHDGIGDTPYNISGGTSQDQYPLMKPFQPDTTPPTIHITKPKDGYLYLFDKEIMKRIFSHTSLIIGTITIEVNASDRESGIDRVEFYIDGISTANDTSMPYSWVWSTKTFFTHTIKVVAYNTADTCTAVSVAVLKFF